MSLSGFCRGGRIALAMFIASAWTLPLHAGPLFDEGKALYGEKAYKHAAKVLNKSLAKEEEADTSTVLLLSDCYIKINKKSKAVDVLTEAAERHPDSWEVHYRLGNLQEEKGDRFGALSAFYQAAQLKPEDNTTLFRLGVAYDSTAQIEKALEMYRKLYRAGSPLAPKLLRTIQGMD
ncbi:tetratricopeptide repeat protein [Desulfoluna sp.]|uniref:tetratricopeptide repeat protein n=1 Tax=Desulfoluna sp. TaxID=2045199 RepID=UPI002622C887|nr:tetratricopeptide repeat protein [Desulfoluna sp.]